MADAEIRETIVVPNADGAVVRLQISDAPLLSESPAILIQMSVRLPAYSMPLLAHYQREALRVTMEVLRKLNTEIGQEIQSSQYDLSPTQKS
jgi:hypothetical protein